MTLILGIESSCDETAAALVTSDRRILAHRLAGQEEAHRPFGGVVPEIAARAHVEILPGLIRRVIDEAGVEVAQIDAIAAGVDHFERREAGLQALTEPQLNLGRRLKNLRPARGRGLYQGGVR